MSYAGMAANVAGTEIQGWAALLEKWAMENAYKSELTRQAQYRDQALGTFNTQLQGKTAGAAGQQMGQALTSRMGDYGRVGGTPTAVNMSPTTSRDRAYAQMLGQQRGQLGSYQDWLLNQKIGDMNTGRTLDQITNFAGGTARVFPYKMYEAQHSQDTLQAIGAALSSLGGGGGASPSQIYSPPQFSQQSQAYYSDPFNTRGNYDDPSYIGNMGNWMANTQQGASPTFFSPAY